MNLTLEERERWAHIQTRRGIIALHNELIARDLEILGRDICARTGLKPPLAIAPDGSAVEAAPAQAEAVQTAAADTTEKDAPP